jgi:hypothetical protein
MKERETKKERGKRERETEKQRDREKERLRQFVLLARKLTGSETQVAAFVRHNVHTVRKNLLT